MRRGRTSLFYYAFERRRHVRTLFIHSQNRFFFFKFSLKNLARDKELYTLKLYVENPRAKRR